MNSFKQLVTEVKTQMDKDVKFLIDHGIDPSTKYSNIPLYDPELNSLVLLRGPVKTSPYFNNEGKISPEDKVIIQTVNEYRIPTSATNSGNYYVKDYGKERIELTVDEFKKRIYNHPRNTETKEYLRLKDLDSSDAITQANDEYTTAREQQDRAKKSEFETWVNRYESFFDLDNLTKQDKKLALDKLYKANKQGYAIKDLSKLPIIWKIKNKQTFDIFNKKIADIKDEITRNQLKNEFTSKQKEWFKEKLDKVEILLKAKDWWNNTTKQESILTELSFPQTEKPTPIKDKYEVKQTLKQLGIDDRFITVPIIKEPIYNKQKYKSAEEDPRADRIQKLLVVSFPDNTKLDDNLGLVRVKDTVSGESFNMNIGELRSLINKEENQNTELDTVDFRLQGGNEFTSLNQGMGRFVDIPEDVIIEMLRTVNKENDDYEYVDLIEYYNDEKKSGIPNPLLTKALTKYNTGNTKQFVIRKFNTADGIKYKGFIPYEDHVRSKPAMAGKDPYKQLFK